MDNNTRDKKLEQKIDAYVKGQLSEEEAEQLWIQLMKQPEYIPLLQTEVDLASIHQHNTEAKSGTTYYWKWIASAAAVVLIAIALNVFTNGGQDSISDWSTKNITLSEHLMSAEITRSSQTGLEPADSLLNAGFKAALSGQVDSAVALFEQIVANHDSTKTISKAYVNLGILNYNSGDFKSSIDSFNRAISTAGDDSLLMEQSYWYLSNAFINTKQFKDAKDALHKAIDMGKVYKNEASNLLKRLDDELQNIDIDSSDQPTKEKE